MDTISPKFKARIQLHAPDLSEESLTRLTENHEFTRYEEGNSGLFEKEMEGTYSDLLAYTNSMRGIPGVLSARIDVVQEKEPPDMRIEKK